MPITFTAAQRTSLLRALRTGRGNAIGASTLAATLGFPVGGNQVRLRTLIKECIEHDGDLIGSATSRPAGFFKIGSLPELETYLDSLERRTRSDNTRRTALINNWNAINPHTTKRILRIT